jgi:DtxR family transcriptional regulator, Mn-dependent transcriptional regulator
MTAITGIMQDYLKAIYKLQRGRDSVSTSELAKRMHVAAATVTAMVQRLARLKLVSYHRYRGLTLTPAGQRVALETIRHHRLIELHLRQQLGVSLDKVDREAERMEHVLSSDVERRMAAALGNPAVDPHGDPIPSLEGTVHDVRYPDLSTLPPGTSGIVARVSDRDPAALRRLTGLGILPGVALTVVAQHPRSCEVELPAGRVTIPRAVSKGVYIRHSAS